MNTEEKSDPFPTPKKKQRRCVIFSERIYSSWPCWIIQLHVMGSQFDIESHPARYFCRATDARAAFQTAAFFWRRWEKDRILGRGQDKSPQVEDVIIAYKISDDEFSKAWELAQKHQHLSAHPPEKFYQPQAFVFWEKMPEYWKIKFSEMPDVRELFRSIKSPMES